MISLRVQPLGPRGRACPNALSANSAGDVYSLQRKQEEGLIGNHYETSRLIAMYTLVVSPFQMYPDIKKMAKERV